MKQQTNNHKVQQSLLATFSRNFYLGYRDEDDDLDLQPRLDFLKPKFHNEEDKPGQDEQYVKNKI